VPGAAQHGADGIEHVRIVIDYKQGRDGEGPPVVMISRSD
jgi:hypothetical protein